MSEATTIDVREMQPRDRHPRIFAAFDALAPGEAILLVNDHDPKPLFYQFQAERPGQVSWSPQEQGPERWAIRIEKTAAATAGDAGPLVLDVREDIAAGREPFGKIMAAVKSLAPAQPLVLVNSFEPVPLYGVLEQQGFAHQAERAADGAWRVTFTR
jgi:uncharacterized protein (DUF2249 family)